MAIDIDRLESFLGIEAERSGADATIDINRENAAKRIVVNLFETDDGDVLSVQTGFGYFELHDPLGFVTVEPDEVIFFAGEGDHLSCLLVGGSGTCSVFANVDRRLLDAEPSDLDPAHMLAAMQLGLVSLERSRA